MKINELTISEENLMLVIWKLNSAYMKEIMENIAEPKPHQNTVSTFLKILVEKGFLDTKKEGRIFKYQVTVPFDDYKKYKLEHFVQTYFSGSAKELIDYISSEKMISKDDLNANPTSESSKSLKKETNIDEIFPSKNLKKNKEKKEKSKKKNKKKKQ